MSIWLLADDLKVPANTLERLELSEGEMSQVQFDELFKALWYEAIGIALSRYQSSPSFIERDTELLKRLKRIRSKDVGII